ncbi:hypothetical protein DYB37_005410 [Aphanomyces astaci]|uniref:Uncharacterized protein n=1 Tax=Aphanomyces astaci TaxID=112090 RepID=A0A418DS30_APHAT|nr:hypothetical protein DYB35_007462 [Aphanomyces astaci]RHZ13351.1 hypothetical protein DYB37_005410 [Aphanomyces astaci]
MGPSAHVASKRQKLLAEQAMLQQSLVLLEADTHEDLVSRLVPLASERVRAIAKAETMSAHLMNSANVIYVYECEEAEKEYELSCSKLKHDMLEEIRLEMERVKEQKRSGVGSASYNKAALALQRQTNMRKTRSSKKPTARSLASLGFAEDWARPAAKRLTTVFTPLHKTLSATEIADDVELMESLERTFDEAEEAVRRRKASSTSPVADQTSVFARFVRGKVLYRDMVLQEDDHIHVTKFVVPPATSSATVQQLPNEAPVVEYNAIVCDLTSAEIFVLKENGKYTRLLVQDLRNGSVVIDPADGDENE